MKRFFKTDKMAIGHLDYTVLRNAAKINLGIDSGTTTKTVGADAGPTKGWLVAAMAIIGMTPTALAANGWVECTMHWLEVEANGEINTSVTMPLRYHAAAGVMEFEKIKLQAQIQGTNIETLEDGTQIRLAVWTEDAGYRMSYVWQDLNNGIDYEINGQELFAPNVIWQAHFFGGRLNCH
jgi:hypothetical protein